MPALVTCGGGGNGGADFSTPAGTLPTPTVPVTQPIQSVGLQTALTPPFALALYAEVALDNFNNIRISMGLSPLNQNAKLNDAACNHQTFVGKATGSVTRMTNDMPTDKTRTVAQAILSAAAPNYIILLF